LKLLSQKYNATKKQKNCGSSRLCFGLKTFALILLILSKNLAHKQQRLVEAWAELHQDELMADWNLLISGQCVEPIKPLN
jgi:hypothetical protein